MTPDEITTIVTALGNLTNVLHTADPADKATIYQRLGLKLTYNEETHTVQVQAQPDLTDMGFPSCPRDHTNPNPTRAALGWRRHAVVGVVVGST